MTPPSGMAPYVARMEAMASEHFGVPVTYDHDRECFFVPEDAYRAKKAEIEAAKRAAPPPREDTVTSYVPKIPKPRLDPEALRRMGESLNRLGESFRSASTAGERLTGQLARMDPTRLALFGWPVVVSPLLPGPAPSHKEDAVRIVRHGMRDVLEWLGEDPGPAPGARTHIVAVDAGRHFLMSAELWERLTVESVMTYPDAPAGDTVRAMREAMTAAQYRRGKVGVFMTDEEAA